MTRSNALFYVVDYVGLNTKYVFILPHMKREGGRVTFITTYDNVPDLTQ